MLGASMKSASAALAVLAMGLGAVASTPIAAQNAREVPVSLRDTFPIGSNALCEAQILAPEAGAGLFDRKYSVICRDAAAPVGTLWVKRGRLAGEAERQFGGAAATCSANGSGASVEGLSNTRSLVCQSDASPIRSDLIVGEVGNRTYAASGLSAYSKALELGLGSLATDRVLPGTVDIPLTQTTDTIAFARQQAEALAADQALVEAYRRSNNGQFAEAAEFFSASAAALTGDGGVEAILNQALLQSNLGNYSEAQRLFARTRAEASLLPVLARLQRNYEAIDALNQDRVEAAYTRLNTPLPNEFGDPAELRELRIGEALANRLAAENEQAAGSSFANSLTDLERAQLLDGQADYLRATSLRLLGRDDEAISRLLSANRDLASVRDGRVISIIWLRAQVLGELGDLSERNGQLEQAEQLHLDGIGLLAEIHPGTPAYQSARARLAGLYARTGRTSDALGLYRAIVSEAGGQSSPSLRNLLAPYFDLLLSGTGQAEAASDIFAASQLLQRPGLAQTQAVLARELSSGSDEASLLFRKTVNLGRAVERERSSIQRLQSQEPTADLESLIAERQETLAQLQSQQAEILQQLAQYPRYRAVSDDVIDLAGLQAILRPGESYLKMITLERETFVVFVTPSDVVAYRAAASPEELALLVARIRESIAIAEGGQVLTFPFDLAGARELYVGLFGPIADRLTSQRHIVFEPDGAMLKLPINLLVTDDASVQAYNDRMRDPNADEYDFRGTAWLGRNAEISTSVSPSAFRDVRASRPSEASRSYLGLGQNLPIEGSAMGQATTRSVAAGGEDCLWSPTIWANPISPAELYDAASRLGGESGQGTTVLTRAEFTDTAIKSREDLGDYRILHFATHGLVTAPQPGCPPRPALLTSFGDVGSDGLLSFGEIFGLRIDADLVILSACDTAGSATIGATREAGVTSGGDFALDGLVRALVGAGGRTILASHWPVPDDFNATQRLVSGLFAESGMQTAEALRQSQLNLMDDADTSHPFYWSAFAVVGDGSVAVMR